MGSCDSTLYAVAWAVAGVMTVAAAYFGYALYREQKISKVNQMMANGYGAPQHAISPQQMNMQQYPSGPPPGAWGSYAPVPMQPR
jgi:hypothetical protein